MIALRILIGALIAIAIGLAVVPLVVLLDLKDGGTGWGLCPDGMNACRSSYFAGFEMLTAVVIVLVAIVAVVALAMRLMRVLERRRRQQTTV